MPVRIQRQRTKGWKVPEGAVYVGRPTVFGNPYKVGDPYVLGTIADSAFAVRLFQTYARIGIRLGDIRSLRGKDLCCWCPLDQPCHADVLLELANRDEGDRLREPDREAV